MLQLVTGQDSGLVVPLVEQALKDSQANAEAFAMVSDCSSCHSCSSAMTGTPTLSAKWADLVLQSEDHWYIVSGMLALTCKICF